MVETYLRQSPLAHAHLYAGSADNNLAPGISITEVPHRQQFALRGSSSDNTFMSIVEEVLSTPIPTEPCQSSGSSDTVHILWIGPDEWLIVAPEDGDIDFGLKLSRALADHHASVVDVSDSRTTVRLSGIYAREVLTKGCSIDLHPRAFSKDCVVNTLLAQAHVTLHQIEDEENSDNCSYDIFVHRSFAEYLWSWFEDALREYR